MIKFSRIIIAFAMLINASSMAAQEFDKKGLMYRITSTDKKTVDLIGFEKKPKEVLIIPEEVSYKGEKYSVDAIGINAFMDCTVLTKVVSTTIKTVKEKAFQGCSSLTNVSFTDELSVVERNAFNGCTSLKTVSLGNNVQTIGDAAFSDCSSMSEISFGSCLKSLGKRIINGTMITTITLPNSLTKIDAQAFSECEKLSNVTFGNALKEIGKNAFEKTSVASLSFPNSLVTIDDKAFYGCVKLESVSFGNSLENIGSSTFEGTCLTNLTIPALIRNINSYTFANCKSLKQVSLNEKLEKISEKAFYGCSLLSIDITDCMAEVADNAFEGCKEVTSAEYSLKGLSNYLKGNKNISNIDYKNGFAKIEFKNSSKCEVITKYGKVVSSNNGYVVSDGLIMVPMDNKGLVLKDTKGKVLSKNYYDDIYSDDLAYKKIANFQDGFLIVKRNNKFGFIDTTGNEIVPCIYNQVWDYKDGFAVVFGDYDDFHGVNKRGLVNTKGKEIVPCNMAREEFSLHTYQGEYVAYLNNPFSENGKFGVIDKNGEIIIPFKYDEIGFFSDGLFSARIDEKWGCVDKSNNTIIPFNYNAMIAFHNGLALIEKGSKKGFIDKAGNVVIPAKYDYAEEFSGNITCVSIPNEAKEGWSKPGIIDKTGKVIYPFSDVEIEKVEDSDFYIVRKNDNETLMGEVGIIGNYSNPFNFEFQTSKIFWGVEKGDKIGVIGRKGNVIVPLDLKVNQEINTGGDGLIYVKDKNCNTKIYNESGKIAEYPSSYSVKMIQNGIIELYKDGKYGFADETGKEIASCVYSKIEISQNGYVICYKDGLCGVLDKKGKEIMPFKYKEIYCYDDGLSVVLDKDHGIGFVDIKGKSTFDYE